MRNDEEKEKGREIVCETTVFSLCYLLCCIRIPLEKQNSACIKPLRLYF